MQFGSDVCWRARNTSARDVAGGSVVCATQALSVRVDPATITVDVPAPVGTVDYARDDTHLRELTAQQLLEFFGLLETARQKSLG